MIPHQCPVCNGHGTVSKPPWVAGDIQGWTDCSTVPYVCRACEGTGIIWESHCKPAGNLGEEEEDEQA